MMMETLFLMDILDAVYSGLIVGVALRQLYQKMEMAYMAKSPDQPTCYRLTEEI